MKQAITVLSLIALAAAALFWRQVWSIFAGMSVLESLEYIVTFILHVAVGTVAAYVVVGLPAIVKPWVRMFRQKQRGMRRGRIVVQAKTPTIKPGKLTVDQLLGLIAPHRTISKVPTQPPQDDTADLRF